MHKILLWVMILGSLFALVGCYQMHSDDDLRSIPVTNNPNVVPSAGVGGISRFVPV